MHAAYSFAQRVCLQNSIVLSTQGGPKAADIRSVIEPNPPDVRRLTTRQKGSSRMLARIRKSMEEKDQGFTLIELLVVMIIIGILAAIAIPVFLNQRAKARDTATKADVSTVGKEIASYYVDQTGGLTVAVAPGTATITVTAGGAAVTTTNVSDGTALDTSKVVSADDWCVSFTNPNGSSSKIWQYSHDGGLKAGTCP